MGGAPLLKGQLRRALRPTEARPLICKRPCVMGPRLSLPAFPFPSPLCQQEREFSTLQQNSGAPGPVPKRAPTPAVLGLKRVSPRAPASPVSLAVLQGCGGPGLLPAPLCLWRPRNSRAPRMSWIKTLESWLHPPSLCDLGQVS